MPATSWPTPATVTIRSSPTAGCRPLHWAVISAPMKCVSVWAYASKSGRRGGDAPPGEPAPHRPHDHGREDHDERQQDDSDNQRGDRMCERKIAEADHEYVFTDAECTVGDGLRTRVRDRSRARLGEMTSRCDGAAEQRHEPFDAR